MNHRVCNLDDIPLGGWKAFSIAGKDILIGRTPTGDVFAMRDYCPHFGTKLSLGSLEPLRSSTEPGKYSNAPGQFVMRCPWHGFEFGLADGQCIADSKIRTRAYKASVEENFISVDL